jgi:hypothetical protein
MSRYYLSLKPRSESTAKDLPVSPTKGLTGGAGRGLQWGNSAADGNLLGPSTTANASGFYVPVSVAQTYGYDNINRPTSASETATGVTSWSRNFRYDNREDELGISQRITGCFYHE